MRSHCLLLPFEVQFERTANLVACRLALVLHLFDFYYLGVVVGRDAGQILRFRINAVLLYKPFFNLLLVQDRF
jgi:hypothetical protein